MRAKRYFWNMRHHRELDFRMGLAKRMAEPFAQLAEACGMTSYLDGTKALSPFFVFSTRHGDIKQTKPYDVTNDEAKRTFLPATALHRLS